jgi:hypothetical protein
MKEVVNTIINFSSILVVFVLFITPIITDFLILRKQITLRDSLIYTATKTVVYIAFLFLPIFIIDILHLLFILNPNASWNDNSSIYFLNHYTVDYTFWFLFFGGMLALIIIKSLALRYLKTKPNILLLFNEIFYAPFLFVVIFFSLWNMNSLS